MNAAFSHIIIVAGETSGDIHGSLLVRELKVLHPQLTFSGLGGPRLRQAGVTLYEDLTQIAVVGFWEVLKNFFKFKKIFDNVLRRIEETKPAAVILVDYPGFNLRLARAIKKRQIPTKVIYYISPQVWAWKESRVNLIRQVVDQMIVLFSFEKKFYQKRGFAVEFVGHPLMDHIQVKQTKEQTLAALGWNANRLTIGILPGSREKEVDQILGPMLGAARKIYQEFSSVQFLILKAPSISSTRIARFLPLQDLPILVVDHSYDFLNACDVCLVASGTATLETAILGKPMVVIYRTSLLTWALAKMLIKIPYIGLVNVVAGKKVVAECIQFDANAKKIAEELRAIFTNEPRVAEIKSELRNVKESLGESGASRRAAQKISRFLGL